ncbi:9544_t:CDS:2 [Entrophospora sp. SA101]|nr:9544_t:CDS:2 [Entrophospora sp. SA101]
MIKRELEELEKYTIKERNLEPYHITSHFGTLITPIHSSRSHPRSRTKDLVSRHQHNAGSRQTILSSFIFSWVYAGGSNECRTKDLVSRHQHNAGSRQTILSSFIFSWVYAGGSNECLRS